MSFIEFARGDIRDQNNASVEITDGTVAIVNGSQIVKTLRSGVAGSHRGTLEGSISFNKPVPKAGEADNFLDLVVSQNPVTVSAIINDAVTIKVTGIIKGGNYKFSETSMVGASYAVEGQITVQKT